MRYLLLALLLGLWACGPAPLPETPDETFLSAADSATVRHHLMVLSHDSLQGRGTGTEGENKAVRYIADQMASYGLEPAGDDGTFFQQVPLMGSTPTATEPLTFFHEDGRTLPLNFVSEYIGSTDMEAANIGFRADVIFVGYGVGCPWLELA